MKNIIIISILILASCSPQKRISRLAEKHPDLIPVKEKIVRDSIYKETVREVEVEVPGDTIRIEAPIDCPDQDVAIFENSKLKQTISILNGKISFLMSIKPDTIKVPVFDTSSQSTNQETKIEYVKYIPKLYKWTLWGFIGLLIITAGMVYLKIKKLWL